METPLNMTARALLELAKQARDIQRKNYGDATGLHLEMIDWATEYDCALALASSLAEQPATISREQDRDESSVRKAIHDLFAEGNLPSWVVRKIYNRVAEQPAKGQFAGMNCRQVPPGNGYCDHCASGNPQLCRYVTPQPDKGEAPIYIDNDGALHSRVSDEQMEAVLGPIVDSLRSKQTPQPDKGEGKPAHLCPEWDYMEVRPGDPEMSACTCDLTTPKPSDPADAEWSSVMTKCYASLARAVSAEGYVIEATGGEISIRKGTTPPTAQRHEEVSDGEEIDWPFTYIIPTSRHEYVPKHHAERKIREAMNRPAGDEMIDRYVEEVSVYLASLNWKDWRIGLTAALNPAAHGAGAAVEEVATVCLVGDRYAHGHIVEVQLQLSSEDAPSPKIGDRYYTAPPQQRSEQVAGGGGVDALPAKWRESAAKLDKGFGLGDALVACGKRVCADELEAALSTQQLLSDSDLCPHGYHPADGCVYCATSDQPVGVSDAMVERAGRAFGAKNELSWDEPSMRAALEAAIHPEQAKDGDVS